MNKCKIIVYIAGVIYNNIWVVFHLVGVQPLSPKGHKTKIKEGEI